MAVYTQVNDDFLEHLLALHPTLGNVVELESIPKGSSNSVFLLKTDASEVILRINENKTLSDIESEVTLLKLLAEFELGFLTPKLIVDVAERALFPLVVKEAGVCIPFAAGFEEPLGEVKYAMLFEKLKGRELAPFEIRPEHLQQMGAHLAEVHGALQNAQNACDFRENPMGLSCLKVWNQVNLRQNEEWGPLFQGALDAVEQQRVDSKRGLIHGDLFPNNTKWRGDELLSIFDWEMAGIDSLTLDLAITLNAWCWVRHEGELQCDWTRVRALLGGYQTKRRLEAPEKRGFVAELKLAALRFTLSRFRDFPSEPPMAEPIPFAGAERTRAKKKRQRAAPVRDHLDFREYWHRYQWLCSKAAEPLSDESFWETL